MKEKEVCYETVGNIVCSVWMREDTVVTGRWSFIKWHKHSNIETHWLWSLAPLRTWSLRRVTCRCHSLLVTCLQTMIHVLHVHQAVPHVATESFSTVLSTTLSSQATLVTGDLSSGAGSDQGRVRWMIDRSRATQETRHQVWNNKYLVVWDYQIFGHKYWSLLSYLKFTKYFMDFHFIHE